MNMAQDIKAQGKWLFATTKVWTDIGYDPIEALKYGFATMMLVNDGDHALGFSLGYGAPTMDTHDWFSFTDYGTPVAPYTIINGLYVREFTKAWIAVNPNTTSSTGFIGGVSTTIPANRALLRLK